MKTFVVDENGVKVEEPLTRSPDPNDHEFCAHSYELNESCDECRKHWRAGAIRFCAIALDSGDYYHQHDSNERIIGCLDDSSLETLLEACIADRAARDRGE